MILAGDIGGTKCTFTLFEHAVSALKPVYRFQAPTREAHSLEELLTRFIASATEAGFPIRNGQLSSAAFGSAGTVVEDKVVINNLPWAVERKSIATTLDLDFQKILLLNDLVAAAASLVHLRKTDVLQLNEGKAQPEAPMALIAAGTGLGEAILFWDGKRYQIFPSEACLTDFAPRNDREFLLLQSLRHRIPRVCTEEIISGRGF